MGILELYAREKKRKFMRRLIRYSSLFCISLLGAVTYIYADDIRLIFESDTRPIEFMTSGEKLPQAGTYSSCPSTPRLLRCKTGKSALQYKQRFQNGFQLLSITGKQERIKEIVNYFNCERTFRISGKQVFVLSSGKQAVLLNHDSLCTLTIISPDSIPN